MFILKSKDISPEDDHWSFGEFVIWEQQPIWIRFENASRTDGGMLFSFPVWHDLGRPGMVRINPG